MISIILPYLSTAKCVPLFKKYLHQNTTCEYELVEIVDSYDVYAAYNYGVSVAKYDKVVLFNDDMFVAPGWNENFEKYIQPKTVTTIWLVESGRIPVNGKMLEYDCGRTPESFDYDRFVNYVNSLDVPEVLEGFENLGAWGPIGFHKSTFVPYPNEIKYPNPNDVTLIEQILPSLGYKFLKIKSFAYHIQRYGRE